MLPAKPYFRSRVLGALLGLFVLGVGTEASAQSARRGPLVVLGLRAPDGDDDVAQASTVAVRRAAREAGFEVPEESPNLEQSIAAFGCDDSLPAECLAQIAGDLHAERMVFGAVRRVGRGRRADVRIEIHAYEQSQRRSRGPATAQFTRVQLPNAAVVAPEVRRMVDEILPPPAPAVAPPATEPSGGTGVTGAATGTGTVTTPREPDAPQSTGVVRYIGYGMLGVGTAMVAAGAITAGVWAGFNAGVQDEGSAWSRYQPFPPNESRASSGSEICTAARANTPNSPGLGPTPDLNDVRSVCDQHATLQTVMWTLIGAGAPILVTGVILVIADPHRAQPAGRRDARRGTARPLAGGAFALTPVLSPGYQGASFRLQF